MNDTAADYSWPACEACGHELWVSEVGRQACRPCEDKTAKRLTELPGIFAQLNTTASLMRGARKVGAATSGSRVPPIPPRLEVLSLVAAGGVATRLRDIEDAWRKALGWTVAPWRGSPAEAVPEHARFLTNNLPWACDAYDSIGQDVDDIRRLHAECAAALAGERRPGRVNVGLCPTLDEETGDACGNQLTASARSPRIQCATCGTEWPDMAAWRDLRRAQEAATETGAAARTRLSGESPLSSGSPSHLRSSGSALSPPCCRRQLCGSCPETASAHSRSQPSAAPSGGAPLTESPTAPKGWQRERPRAETKKYLTVEPK